MKLGILGDVHGNAAALEAVLLELTKNKVEHLIITGDLFGYYFYPQEVIDLLKNLNATFVRGNHEDMLRRARHNPKELVSIELKYGSGIRLALETLTENQLNQIETFPTTAPLNIGGCKILVCHGTPTSNEKCLYPDAPQDVVTEYKSFPYDFIIMGHTHYPMNIEAGAVRLINPGSVGQPRTKKKEASCATLDTKTREVVFCSAAYDATALIKECKIRHPEIPYLADVLIEK